MKYFWAFFAVSIVLLCIIFVALLGYLFKSGSIEFTDEETITEPQLLRSDPLLGSLSPKVIIYHYGNFEAPASAANAEYLHQILSDYPQDVLVVWKDFPNTSLRPQSESAAVAARCAQDQGIFWTYHNLLLSHQQELGSDFYLNAAREAGLRETKFTRCLNRTKPAAAVRAGLQEAIDLKLTTAPTLFVGKQKITGEVDFATLRNIVEQQLAQ